MWYAVKEDMKSLSKAAVFGRTHKNNTKNTKKIKPNLVALTTSGLEMEGPILILVLHKFVMYLLTH